VNPVLILGKFLRSGYISSYGMDCFANMNIAASSPSLMLNRLVLVYGSYVWMGDALLGVHIQHHGKDGGGSLVLRLLPR